MSNRGTSFGRLTRRGAVVGAAVAVFAGASLAPVANAEDTGSGTLLNTLIQTITSGSAGQHQGPSVTLSESVVSEEGEHQITVTGAGFKDASVVGTRPPLAGKNPGVYVALGKFAPQWKPSEGAPSTDRKLIQSYWAVNAEDISAIGGPARGGIELTPEGGFTATFTVSKEIVDAVTGTEGSKLGIYTYPGGGATHAAWETFTPITIGDAESPAGGLSLGSLTNLLPS